MTGRLGMTGGQSAFTKAYIPGVGYRSASNVPKKVLRRARDQKWKPERDTTFDSLRDKEMMGHIGSTMRENEANAVPTGVKNISFAGHPENLERLRSSLPKKGAKRPVVVSDMGNVVDNPEDVETAFAIGRMGPRRPAHVQMSSYQVGNPEAVAHELTHATPRRNLHRLSGLDANKLGREEARADNAGLRRVGNRSTGTEYEAQALNHQEGYAPDVQMTGNGRPIGSKAYGEMRGKLGLPLPSVEEFNMQNDMVADNIRGYTRLNKSAGRLGMTGNSGRFSKAQAGPRTSMSQDDARRVVEQYGSVGALPRNIDRNERMRAYEGRYVAAGGPKAQRWGRRRDQANLVRDAGLATSAGGALGVGLTTAGTRANRASIGALVGGGIAGAAGSEVGRYARNKQKKFRSTPGGVAGGTLRRMQDYTPEG